MTWFSTAAKPPANIVKIASALLPALSIAGTGCQGQEAPRAVRDDSGNAEGHVVDLRPPIDVDASKLALETATFALG